MGTAYEDADYVGDLDVSIPDDNGVEGKRANGAAEIRQLKQAIVNSLAAVTGPVTASHTELNLLDGLDAVKDENDMASDSDTALATQQSIKTYVDTEVAATQQSLETYVDTEVAATAGPAFRVYDSAGFSASTTPSIVDFAGTDFEITNCYDGTNKFLPLKAGKYLVGAQITIPGNGKTQPFIRLDLLKNGVLIARSDTGWAVGQSALSCQVSTLVDMNGSTDYIQVRCYYFNAENDAVTATTGTAFTNFWGTYERT